MEWYYGAVVLWYCGVSEGTRINPQLFHRIDWCFGFVVLWYYGFFPKGISHHLIGKLSPLRAGGGIVVEIWN